MQVSPLRIVHYGTAVLGEQGRNRRTVCAPQTLPVTLPLKLVRQTTAGDLRMDIHGATETNLAPGMRSLTSLPHQR